MTSIPQQQGLIRKTMRCICKSVQLGNRVLVRDTLYKLDYQQKFTTLTS